MTKILVIVHSDDKWQLYPASLLGSDNRTDPAVLKIEHAENKVFPYLAFGDSHQLQLGEDLICIGNPHLFHWTTTVGIVSALDRNYCRASAIEGYIQTDATISFGNSGGPLLDQEGNLVGIITLGIPSMGAGLAVPGHTVQSITHQIIEKGKVSQGFLGIECKRSQQEILDISLFFDSREGARIQYIIPGSPAATAGLEYDDLIV